MLLLCQAGSGCGILPCPLNITGRFHSHNAFWPVLPLPLCPSCSLTLLQPAPSAWLSWCSRYCCPRCARPTRARALARGSSTAATTSPTRTTTTRLSGRPRSTGKDTPATARQFDLALQEQEEDCGNEQRAGCTLPSKPRIPTSPTPLEKWKMHFVQCCTAVHAIKKRCIEFCWSEKRRLGHTWGRDWGQVGGSHGSETSARCCLRLGRKRGGGGSEPPEPPPCVPRP